MQPIKDNFETLENLAFRQTRHAFSMIADEYRNNDFKVDDIKDQLRAK